MNAEGEREAEDDEEEARTGKRARRFSPRCASMACVRPDNRRGVQSTVQLQPADCDEGAGCRPRQEERHTLGGNGGGIESADAWNALFLRRPQGELWGGEQGCDLAGRENRPGWRKWKTRMDGRCDEKRVEKWDKDEAS